LSGFWDMKIRAKCGLKQRLITNAIGSSDPPLVIAKLLSPPRMGLTKVGANLEERISSFSFLLQYYCL
jgi:hypothetical protein